MIAVQSTRQSTSKQRIYSITKYACTGDVLYECTGIIEEVTSELYCYFRSQDKQEAPPEIIYPDKRKFPGRYHSWKITSDPRHWSSYFFRRFLIFGKGLHKQIRQNHGVTSSIMGKNKRRDTQSKHIWIDPKF